MTKCDFVLLLVKLLGLYIIVMAFNSLSSLNMFFHTSIISPLSPVPRLLMALCPFIFQVCFGALLWVFASALVSTITSESTKNELIAGWEPRDIAQVGLIIIGLLAILQATHLVGLAIARAAEFWNVSSPPVLGNFVYYFLPAVPLSLIGLILIFGARFLSFWIAPRGEFVPRQSDETPPDAAN